MKKTMFLASVLCLTACGDDDVSNGGGQLDAGLDSGQVSAPDAAAPDAAAPDASGDRAVTLRFKAKVGNEDLVCGRTYSDVGSARTSITPRDFRLFVQDVRLITSSGSEVPVKLDQRGNYQAPEVALLDFTNGEGSCNDVETGTNTIITGTVPAGDYTGIVFVNGVGEALNHADPTLAPAPLQAPGASWGWLAGYRFLMAEVVATDAQHGDAGVHGGDPGVHGGDAGAHGGDAGVHGGDAGVHGGDAGVHGEGGGHGAGPSGVSAMHLGSTACTGTPATGITCSKANRSEVRLTGFNPTSSTIVADLGAIFSLANLATPVQCHGSGPSCQPMFEALGVNIDTGAPAQNQRVYRVE